MSLGIKRTRPMRAIATSFEGTPGEIPLHFGEMYQWARGRNLRTGDKDSSGRYNLPWTAVLHEEDGMTPETSRKIDLWMPIDGAGSNQGNYTVKDIPHGNVAFMIHKGPMSKFTESIDHLFKWAKEKEQPYRARLHRRIYVRGADANPEDPDWEAEIQIPLLSGRGV